MKNYILSTILISGFFSSYAMDEISHKTTRMRQGLQQLDSYLNEVEADVSRLRLEHSQSLGSCIARCEELEQIQRVKDNPVRLSAFDARKIKEHQCRVSVGIKVVHIYEHQPYGQSLQIGDVIESNENYFRRLSNLSVE